MIDPSRVRAGSVERYATIAGAAGPSIRTSADSSLGVPPGAYDVLIHSDTAHDGFGLIGPGLERRSAAAYVGRRVWHVHLRAGVVYRYSSLCQPRRTMRFSVGR